MGLEADAIVDRRRLKRSRSLWRFVAILAVLVFVVAQMGDLGSLQQSHVARLNISDVILDDEDFVQAVDDIAEDSTTAAVIMTIDSPGGTVTGAEAIYNAVRRVSAKKPVIAVMRSVAASGGYLVALGADHILAQRNTVTGSIGVMLQAPDISGLMQKLGVTVAEIKSAPLKGEPSEFHPLSEEGRKATQAFVNDAYEWFVALVAERRKLKPEEARTLADGRVYSGGQAVANRLIDGLGDETAARKWLEKEYGISEKLPVRDVDTSSRVGPFKIPDSASIAGAILTALTGKSFESKGLALDGLVAIWHPAR